MLIYLLSTLLLSVCYPPTPLPASGGVLHLQVNNVQVAGGWIWVGVYDSEESFLIKEKAIVEGVVVQEAGPISMRIRDVRYGQCAVAVFHDINGNGELDRNWLGIPAEPYAFSRKPVSKWRLPRFWEVAFNFSPQQSKLAVVLDKW